MKATTNQSENVKDKLREVLIEAIPPCEVQNIFPNGELKKEKNKMSKKPFVCEKCDQMKVAGKCINKACKGVKK